MLIGRGSLFTAALLASTGLQAAVPSYTSIEIPSAAGADGNAVATGINRNGDIVGTYSSAAGATPASGGGFVYYHTDGTQVVLPGSGNPSGLAANGINDLDQVVGDLSGPTIGVEPVEWSKNGGESILPIDTLAMATAINNQGDIVGNFDNGHVDNLAIMWVGAAHTPKQLGVLWVDPALPDYATSTATAINSLSHVVGVSDAGQGTDPNTAKPFGQHAFLYRDGRLQDLGALALSTDGSDYSIAFGINSADEVVGASTTNIAAVNPQGQTCPNCGMASHAFLWRGGTMTDLGNLAGIPGWDSQADAINSQGEIVGWSDSMVNGTSSHRAFLYFNGQMLNLQYYVLDRDPNVRLTEAVSINCQGWIVANGFNAQSPSVNRVYLLIPQGEPRACN